MKERTLVSLGNNYLMGSIMKHVDNKFGFTMIELMIALAITSIVTVAATAVFVNLQQTSTEIDSSTKISAYARSANI